jgi:hypothetical protein
MSTCEQQVRHTGNSINQRNMIIFLSGATFLTLCTFVYQYVMHGNDSRCWTSIGVLQVQPYVLLKFEHTTPAKQGDMLQFSAIEHQLKSLIHIKWLKGIERIPR